MKATVPCYTALGRFQLRSIEGRRRRTRVLTIEVHCSLVEVARTRPYLNDSSIPLIYPRPALRPTLQLLLGPQDLCVTHGVGWSSDTKPSRAFSFHFSPSFYSSSSSLRRYSLPRRPMTLKPGTSSGISFAVLIFSCSRLSSAKSSGQHPAAVGNAEHDYHDK
ncbi:hypothetical protein BDN71DRAFT_1104399 [Pleurotus eryngii]|uniref:Uncharacterized protein n=1 Tax=Pleurotus eryngii TaxID=5323 RepID=A0A9P5ZRT5_PLEER|nr:hypothetical protein BDN71DRAFT_1104399 [Pleurotus eryngii]